MVSLSQNYNGGIIMSRPSSAYLDRFIKNYVEEKSNYENDSMNMPDEPLYLKSEKDVLSSLKAIDWSFSEDNTTYLSHDIHPYPAKFVPQLPSTIIELLSSPGDLVWDPFGGSGTTALEALLKDRSCISTDVNPIARIVGRAKTTPVHLDDDLQIKEFLNLLDYYCNNPKSIVDYCLEHKNEIEEVVPAIPNIEKWFEPTSIVELALIKLLIRKRLKASAAIDIAKASFSKIITRVSNQENETTYRAIAKEIELGDTIRSYKKDLDNNYNKIKKVSALIGNRTATFITANVMESCVGNNEMISPETVDLIVTSPPYPNAFDYHLYHRFRIFWLDEDPRDMAKKEIGSHLKYQRGKKDGEQFEKEMKPVLCNCYSALKPGRYAVFVLGNAVFSGKEYITSERIAILAESIGFKVVGVVKRPLPETKRTVKSWARRATDEDILIMKKPSRGAMISLERVKYKMWDYEEVICNLEKKALTKQEEDLFVTNDINVCRRLNKLTFYDSYQIDGTEYKTWESLLEHSVDSSNRKDPKYLTHGIHPYKGKFYPQLVRPLLNMLEIPENGVVFDPFCGSGTVALEAILNGYKAYGCDINPIAVEIAKAKTTAFKINQIEFEEQITIFKGKLKQYDASNDYSAAFAENAMEEINSWFPKPVISKLGFILSEISEVPDERLRVFLRVILSSIIREVSQQDPADLRIRRRKEPIEDAPVIELLIEHLEEQCDRISNYHSVAKYAPSPIQNATIWHGNCTDSDGLFKVFSPDLVDIVITSPPYATALPYIDTNRLNMLVLDGLNSTKRATIESEMTGTREITKKTRDYIENRIIDGDFGQIKSDKAIEIIQKVFVQNKDANVGFRKKNMASLLYLYFEDMSRALANLELVVKKGGYICIVIGDTKTVTGEEMVIIKTTEVLRETGLKLGWTLMYDIPISVTKEKYKHMHNSITENTILVFKK